MSDAALESQGMDLQIGDGDSPELFNSISEISNMSGPGGSGKIIDATDLLSVAKQKRMGLPDEGQLSFDLFYLPADTQHALLRSQRDARAKTNFKLIFTDDSPSTTWSFSAFVTGFSLSSAVDDVLKAKVTLEVTGAISEG